MYHNLNFHKLCHSIAYFCLAIDTEKEAIRPSALVSDKGTKEGRTDGCLGNILRLSLSAPQHAECALEHVCHKENPKNLHDRLKCLLLTQIAVFPKIT